MNKSTWTTLEEVGKHVGISAVGEWYNGLCRPEASYLSPTGAASRSIAARTLSGKISLYSSNRYFLFSTYFLLFLLSTPTERENIVLFSGENARCVSASVSPSAWKRFCIEIWKLCKLTAGGWWIVSQLIVPLIKRSKPKRGLEFSNEIVSPLPIPCRLRSITRSFLVRNIYHLNVLCINRFLNRFLNSKSYVVYYKQVLSSSINVNTYEFEKNLFVYYLNRILV